MDSWYILLLLFSCGHYFNIFTTQSTDIVTRVQTLANAYECALQLIKNQASDQFDTRFLETLEYKSRPLLKFLDDIKKHEQRRTLPPTWGKQGIVNKSLVGYQYSKDSDKENNPVMLL